VTSIVVSCVIFAFFIALDFQSLLDADITLNMVALVLEFAALIVLRRTFPKMVRPYKVPGGVVGAVAIAVVPTALALWLIKSTRVTEPVSFWISVIMVTGCAILYPVARRWIKRGRPDGELDPAGVDFGPGIDAESVIRGEWVRS